MTSFGGANTGEVAERTGRRRRMSRSGWAAIGAAVAVTLGSGGISLVRAAPEVKSEVTPIVPCRLVDTRPGSALGTIRAPIGSGQTVVVAVFGVNGACNIPNGATAVQVNMTALNVTAVRTFVTAYPAGDQRPAASQLNPTSAASVTSNGTVITLSSGGQFALYNDVGSVNLIIDVLAYYTPAVGSTGEQGPPGPVGATGARGPAGATGPSGATGPAGTRGPAGATGPVGAAGPRGPAGADGDDSVPGPRGPAGPAGADGVDGAVGPAGSDGEPGAPGPTGAAGPAGPAGADGARGPAGADGAVGPQGPAGADGEDGADGKDGERGPKGPAGADGADGADGAVGPAGPRGPAGADGDSAEIPYHQVKGPISKFASSAGGTVSALCPSGKVVVGGGFEIIDNAKGNRRPPYVTKSAPSSSTKWTVTAERGSRERDSWSIRAYAICVGI